MLGFIILDTTNLISPNDPSSFWTMVGSVVGVVLLIGAIGKYLFNQIRKQVHGEIEPVLQQTRLVLQQTQLQNEMLRQELDTRLRMPAYAKDVIELTEAGADRKIAELEKLYEEALNAKKKEEAELLASQVTEINSLRVQLSRLASEQHRVQAKLQFQLRSADVEAPPRVNAVLLPTGLIMLVRYNGKYGAMQAVDQFPSSTKQHGGFIRYVWWYQPDGSGLFKTSSTEFGFDEKGNKTSGGISILHVGPIPLGWSFSRSGQGWVYFGSTTSPSLDYEIVITSEIDISRIDAAKYQLYKYKKFVA